MDKREYMEPVFTDLAFEIFAEAVGVEAVRNVFSQDKAAKTIGWDRGVTIENNEYSSWWTATTDEKDLSFVIGSFRMTIPLDRAEKILDTFTSVYDNHKNEGTE
ncbi:MAG TPA: hypothetical protein PKB09_00615 [Candidatus Saccharibacteria bacterium]|nr:hypothetical protein [Candidatus Saccharibacteria bacterium]